jgi:hypothetical protein
MPNAVRLHDEYPRQMHELLAPGVFIDEVAGARQWPGGKKTSRLGQAASPYAKVMNSPPF